MANSVQLHNPRLDRWVKVSTKTGKVIATKKTRGRWKNIPTITRDASQMANWWVTRQYGMVGDR